jgi:hypothetical protein
MYRPILSRVHDGSHSPRAPKSPDIGRELSSRAARIIAAYPLRYPGVMQTWASLVLVQAGERRAA